MNAEYHDLVQRCLAGDAAAWTKFVDEYRSLVYSICNLSKISNNEDADDLAQEAFIRIWMNLSSYDPQRGGLRGWVASVTRNLRVDRFRRSRQHHFTDSIDEGWDTPGPASAAMEVADPRPTPHDAAYAKEVSAIIDRAAVGMSSVMREAVTMRFVQEFDNWEIARRLRIPEGTVKSRINRGRVQLASLLNPMRAALGAA